MARRSGDRHLPKFCAEFADLRRLRRERSVTDRTASTQAVAGERIARALSWAEGMPGRRAARFLPLVLACLCLAGCGRSEGARGPRADVSTIANWTARKHIRGVVDLSAPRQGGSIVVAAAGRLVLLGPDGTLRPFAGAYSAPPGLEPYIALSSGQTLKPARCSFARNKVYALRLNHGNGVTVIDAHGHVGRFASLPSRGLENGIAFDGAGRFGHRLLVTSVAAGSTTVYAIDCNRHVDVLTRNAPRLEGGIAVAPATFGRFAGDLIAPDELSGKLYAIGPDGRSSLVAQSGLPHGQDIGVESEGFVPARFKDALVADRRTHGNRHPGDDLVLGLSHAALAAAGVHPGDLLAVTEGGARTIAVTCTMSCRVRAVADGPRQAHIEGHVVFSAAL
jgi:hypothetical protein